VAICLCVTIASESFSQDSVSKIKSVVAEKARPFKILTNGKTITIRSNSKLNSIMVWSSNGNRFIEQTNIDANSYDFTIPPKDKYVFVMVEIGGKRYTEKIGVYYTN